tara:strand:+ start:147 stop:248 length:102 start_codon:yes stop_codon:yes gene_type:complete
MTGKFKEGFRPTDTGILGYFEYPGVCIKKERVF